MRHQALAGQGCSPEVGALNLHKTVFGTLREALEDESELVREHAAWALGRLRS
jgi:epoxyqueuosine reductase QueG